MVSLAARKTALVWAHIDRNVSVVTLILSIMALLMVPPTARSSLGVGGLGPNSASPFFLSSSALAAAGPFALISFLHTHKQQQVKDQIARSREDVLILKLDK